MVAHTKRPHANRPRVLVIAHRIDREGQGMERLHARLAELMSSRYEVHVLVGAIDAHTAQFVTVHQVPLIERPIPLRFVMFCILASIRLVWLAKNMNVLHSCGAIVVNRVDVVSVHLCQAAVVEANGGHLMPSTGSLIRRLNTGALKALALHLERFAFRTHTKTLAAAVSERGLEELATFYPMTPRALTENGVDGEVFYPDVENRIATRALLNLGDKDFVQLLVGGDWTLRGVELAIASLTELPENVTLLIVGRGDRIRMEALCSSLGVGNRVRFLGVRNDLTDLYRAADVLIQMSAYETFSLVLVEAALSGLALVSTDVGVATWLCGEDQSGGLLIERSSEALAAGVAFVMEHQEVSRNRAEVAERRAQRFTLNHLVDQVEKVYEQILDAQ